MLPSVHKLAGELYNKYQLVCNIGRSVISFLLFVLFGVDKFKVGNFLKGISKWVVKALVKIKMIKDYETEAAEYRANKDRLLSDARHLQDKIDEKLSGEKND